MLSHLQLSYSRVETSLQTLIDSIAAYNPSVSAAESLLAADAQVSEDLDLLVTHQRNALRLAELRQTSASLDETIKATIRLLAETRRDVQGIAPFVGAGEEDASSGSRGSDSQGQGSGGRTKTLPVKDVLSYAKFISKTSIPPTYRAPPPSSSTPENTNNPSMAGAPPTPAAAAAAQTTNGLTTPTTAISSPPPTLPTTTTTNTALSALPSTTASFLNPTAENLPFQPWPSQEVIASGALGNLQRMVEAGQDPAAVKSKEEEEEERRREEEEEAREEERRREMARRMEGEHGGGGGHGGGGVVAFNPDDL